MMYLATVPREHLIASSKRQPLKNDVVNPRPQTRQPGRFAVRVGIQQGLHLISIGPK